VVDQLNNRLQRFAADGSVLGVWGAAGAGSGELRTPFGVAVGGGHVYVADFGNDRVQVYAVDGSPITSLGVRGSGDGQFLRPAGVAVGPDGTVYVTDHFNDRVERFGVDGRFQAQLGTSQAPGPFGLVPGAATVLPTPSPTLVLAGSPAIGVTPTVQASAPPVATQLRRPEGIILDRDGNLWVADYGHDRVVKLAPDGHLLLSWGARGSGLGEFIGPKGIALDPLSGRLYVADTGNARIQRLAPDGTPEAAWPLP
jgi:DNA-binding beta-propeller fold protein YncE